MQRAGGIAASECGIGSTGGGQRALGIELDDSVEGGIERLDASKVRFGDFA